MTAISTSRAAGVGAQPETGRARARVGGVAGDRQRGAEPRHEAEDDGEAPAPEPGDEPLPDGRPGETQMCGQEQAEGRRDALNGIHGGSSGALDTPNV